MNDHAFIDSLKERLLNNPLLAKDILIAVAEAQEEYQRRLSFQRNCQATNAILDLIAAFQEKRFKRFPIDKQKIHLKRVIEYQFPNGLEAHCPYEREFYEKYKEEK